jgi:hypothetical protein
MGENDILSVLLDLPKSGLSDVPSHWTYEPGFPTKMALGFDSEMDSSAVPA